MQNSFLTIFGGARKKKTKSLDQNLNALQTDRKYAIFGKGWFRNRILEDYFPKSPPASSGTVRRLFARLRRFGTSRFLETPPRSICFLHPPLTTYDWSSDSTSNSVE